MNNHELRERFNLIRLAPNSMLMDDVELATAAPPAHALGLQSGQIEWLRRCNPAFRRCHRAGEIAARDTAAARRTIDAYRKAEVEKEKANAEKI